MGIVTRIVPRFRRPAGRAKTVLSPEGWRYLVLLAAILGLAMLRQINLVLVLAGMLVGPLAFSWWLAQRTLRGLKVSRKVPRRICAGDPLVVHLELNNGRRSGGSWAVVVEDEVRREGAAPDETPARPQAVFSYVPAGQSCDAVCEGRLWRRGRYRVGPLSVSTRFPFGLIRHTVVQDLADTVYVYPRLGRLTRPWRIRHREAFEGSQQREQRFGQLSGDFYGVREWQWGDSRRWIHWRSSARHGSLVVRQFECYRSRDAAVLVDLWQPERPGPEHRDNVELAVSFAATLIEDLCRNTSGELWLGIGGREISWTSGPASPIVRENALERLAVAEASSTDRLPELLEQALEQIDPGVEIVLVSPRAVDLADASRFPAFQRSAAWRAAASRMRRINTASEDLAHDFVAE